MPLDGCFLHLLKNELNEELENSRIDKIYQPSNNETVFVFRGYKKVKKLLVCTNSAEVRVCFLNETPENPAQPPMFCMLLRKHLSGAKFLGVEQDGFERVITFLFESVNEMGDIVHPKFAVELVGKQTNAVLIGGDGRIIDCQKRSDIELHDRIVQPGAVYKPPERQNKFNILSDSIDIIIDKIKTENGKLTTALLNCLDGFSPLVCREIVFSSFCDLDITVPQITDFSPLYDRLAFVRNTLADGGSPTIIKNGEKEIDFSFMPINQYGAGFENSEEPSFSDTLNGFYEKHGRRNRINNLSSDLLKSLNNLKNRTERKINARKRDLQKCQSREKYRVYGELIKANIFRIEKGAAFAELENYYSENLETVKIPLDNALSPAQNAQKYFKEYKKLCVASNTLGGLIEKSENDYKYIESVIDSLSRAQTVAEIESIREEVQDSGLIKQRRQKKRSKPQNLPYSEYMSPDGFRVMVGRNNKQNDELTFKVAKKNDLWLHAKNIPGSHIIIVTNGEEVPEETIVFAAKLAAENSKGASSSNVPVDCVEARYVKKPNGAKPGMVVFTNNRTLFVTPEKSL